MLITIFVDATMRPFIGKVFSSCPLRSFQMGCPEKNFATFNEKPF